MARWVVVSCLLSVCLTGGNVAAEPLTGEANRIVTQAESQIGRIRKDADAAALSAQDKALKDVMGIQLKLTMEANLDDAVSVRDFLRAVQEKTGLSARRQAMGAGVIRLPEAASAIVSEYLESSETADREANQQIEQIEADKNKKLEPLFKKATEAGDLDAAIAIRKAMGSSRQEGSSPAAAGQLPTIKFSKDPQQARVQYQQQVGRLSVQEAEQLGRFVRDVIPEFQAALLKLTRAGELDTAVTVRNLITAVNAEKTPAAQAALIRKAQPTLTGDAAEISLKFTGQADKVATEIGELKRQIGESFAETLELEVQRVLLEGDATRSRSILMEYFMTRQDFGNIRGLNQLNDSSSLSDATVERLRQFHEQSIERLDQAKEKEQKTRAALVEKLRLIRQTPETTGAQGETIDFLVEFSEEDYTQGLQAMLLFPAWKELPDGAREAADTYRGELKSIRSELRSAHAAAVKMFVNEMQAFLRERILAGSYVEAYKLRDRLTKLQIVDEPLPIKIARSPFSDHLWDAQLIEMRGENSLLIRYGVGGTEEWLPRNRVKFLPEDKIAVADLRNGGQPEGPGIPLSSSVKVKRGMKAFKYWGHSWMPVTIQEVAADGIRFTWDNWSNREETCPRSDLRILED